MSYMNMCDRVVRSSKWVRGILCHTLSLANCARGVGSPTLINELVRKYLDYFALL